MLVAVSLSGCAIPGVKQPGQGPKVSSHSPSEFTFEQHEVVTGSMKRPTVLNGFFLDGAMAELAVVNIDQNAARRLRLFAFESGGWKPKLDATLRREVLFVDVAKIRGRDRLVTYGSGRLSWFDPQSKTERLLKAVAFNYKPISEGEIPQVDITRDINGDDRDDLVFPDVDGFLISTQRSNGSFTNAKKLGPPEPFRNEVGLDESGLDDSRSYGEVGITDFTLPFYLSRVHQMDYNQDGRNDIVFWNEDHFDVHLQNKRGLF